MYTEALSELLMKHFTKYISYSLYLLIPAFLFYVVLTIVFIYLMYLLILYLRNNIKPCIKEDKNNNSQIKTFNIM